VVINGAMQVAQRGTSTASITTAGYYTADRFNFSLSSIGTWTQSLESDAPTGSGLRNSLKVLCTTADASPAASDYMLIEHKLEGQNVQQFAKGTASAKPFAVSFWIKSNKTGTYILELQDTDNGRQVSSSYSVSASGTWEKKTIIFPADTTGAFTNDNALSLQINFFLGLGSNFTSGTLNTTWGTTVDANRGVGQTNLAAATSNYWQITGVQLEAGSVATPFEFEDIGTTLAKCQRYYESVSWGLFYGTALGGTDLYLPLSYRVTKRVAPTVTLPSSTNAIKNSSNVNATPGFAWTTNTTTDMFNIYAGSSSIWAINAGTATASAEL
jgi:hypothetical protein